MFSNTTCLNSDPLGGQIFWLTTNTWAGKVTWYMWEESLTVWVDINSQDELGVAYTLVARYRREDWSAVFIRITDGKAVLYLNKNGTGNLIWRMRRLFTTHAYLWALYVLLKDFLRWHMKLFLPLWKGCLQVGRKSGSLVQGLLFCGSGS